MELKQYLLIVRRWVWLLILGLILGASGGFFGSNYQTPVYQASTRLLVMRAPQEKTSDYTYLSDQQLIQTYIQLVTTKPVLEAVAAEVGYAVYAKQITVQQIRDTQVIQLTVEDGNPTRSAEIANTLVTQLIKQNEALQSSRFTSTETSLQEQIKQMEKQISGLQTVINQVTTQNLKDQIAQIEAQIAPLQEEVSTLEKEIAAIPISSTLKTENKIKVAEMQTRLDQIKPLLGLYQEIYSNLVVLGKPFENGSSEDLRLTQLQTTLSLYQQIYINLLNSLESIRLARLQNTPNIVQIEPAFPPETPIRPRPLMNTALAGAVGFMLAAGIVFLIEYLDDTLKTPEDVERALGLPVLGFVAEMKYKKKSAAEIYISRQPRSPVSEAFRSLRTNLEFSAVEKPISTILVTSPGPSEGKTTVAVNLAAIFSQAKNRVVLIDADMRRPHVHHLMGMSNREGLSDLFLNQTQTINVGRGREDLPHLLVITSGSLPPNPAELLGSEKMSRILKQLSQNVDVVIIDTPPSLVADAQILATKVDAVLFVIQPGVTHMATAKASLDMFKRSGARVVGVVLNRIPRSRSDYYGGHKYYSPYKKGKGYFSEVDTKPVAIPEETPIEAVNRFTAEAHPMPSYLNKLFGKLNEVPPSPDPEKSDIPK